MGRRGKRQSHRRRHPPPPLLAPPPPPPPPPGSSITDIENWLGYNGAILVLFETPSGFALFLYSGVRLFLPNAVENIWADLILVSRAEGIIWLKDFRILKDKANAITDTGVSVEFSRMIKKWLLPGQRLAVGKAEYKTIIEARLGVYCLFDEAVMEVMWGLKNLMKSLVPQEKSDLAKEDLQMSQGMKKVLDRYGFTVKPEMVNEDIIEMASGLYECDYCAKKHAIALNSATELLTKLDFKCQDWTPEKLITAMVVLCFPERKVKTGDSSEMLSEVEVSKLVELAPQSTAKFDRRSLMVIYEDIIQASVIRTRVRMKMELLIKVAQRAEHAESSK